jgi:hypothetical protein
VVDEPDKPRGGPPKGGAASTEPEEDRSTDEAEENDRPTVSPPFDPIAFARDILKPSPAPMPAVTPRHDLHTHATPPAGTEVQAAAARASRRSGRTPNPRRRTPTSTISLANARIPSNLPPRPTAQPRAEEPKKHESLATKNPVEMEWADLEIATRPPPADGPGEDPVIEIAQDRPPQLDLDDIELDEEAPSTVRRPVPDELRASASQPQPQPPPPAPIPAKSRSREMNDRVELGDYSGALEIAEEILRTNSDDIGAKTVAETCRTVLRQMYATRIGPLERVPVVMVPRDQLRWLSIDHKAGFVLSLVDGVSSLEMIIDVSGMPELDTLRILSELAQQRIISLR